MIKLFLLKCIYKPWLKRAARQIIEGRWIDPKNPKKGRFLKPQMKQLLRDIWEQVDLLLPQARLEELPTFGNQHNVYLAVLTTAGYRAMLNVVKDPDYAATLIADAGWKIYDLMFRLASFPYRLTSRDPQKRIDRTLHALMIFPFSAPGKPGYEVEVKSHNNKTETNWTHCPPQTFVRSLRKNDKDMGELDAFYKSWCLYDWPGADVLVNDGTTGHYTRKKTLSRGNKVCDMCWIGEVIQK